MYKQSEDPKKILHFYDIQIGLANGLKSMILGP